MQIFSQFEQTLLSQMEKILAEPFSQKVSDWQEMLGEIEAAEPLAEETGQSFGIDFEKLAQDASKINPNSPTNLSQIQADLNLLKLQTIPAPPYNDPQYKSAIASGSCNVLEGLITSNPKNQYEIGGVINVLIEFTSELSLPSPNAEDLQNLYNSYIHNPSNQGLANLEQSLSIFAANLEPYL